MGNQLRYHGDSRHSTPRGDTEGERVRINNKYFNIKIPLLAGYICAWEKTEQRRGCSDASTFPSSSLLFIISQKRRNLWGILRKIRPQQPELLSWDLFDFIWAGLAAAGRRGTSTAHVCTCPSYSGSFQAVSIYWLVFLFYRHLAIVPLKLGSHKCVSQNGKLNKAGRAAKGEVWVNFYP